MVNTVNKIPSINLPLTNEQGVIHPIWYEFLRSFISSVGDGSGGSTADNTVIAGAGILGAASVDTVNVGQGEGLRVNANDVAVDITGQINAQAAPEDEILIADASDNSLIRKTSLRDVANLSPGTTPGGNDLAVQYNNNGLFDGDDSFTTDGSGNVSIVGSLNIDDININGNTFTSASNTTPLVFNVPSGGLNQFLFAQTGSASSATTFEVRGAAAETSLIVRSDNGGTSSLADSYMSFATDTGSPEWSMGLYNSQDNDFVLANGAGLNVNTIFTVDRGDRYFAHNTNLKRLTVTGITASTTQTQGNGALTGDVNEIATVANNNDTVTLPGAQSGSIVRIINNGVNTLQIFPASGDDLGNGTNASTTLATGLDATFIALNAATWKKSLNGSSSNNFSTISVSGQSDIVADQSSDTLTLANGTAIGITTNATTDTITVAVTDAELTALAGLTSAADKLPYFTGSGTAGLADISSAMRTFMTTPSSANLRSLLTDESGTGAAIFAGGALGACSATSISFGDEALSAYDEGTWTPTITFATPGDLSVSYSTQVGTYTRIGRLAYVECTLNFTPTYTTATGLFSVTGGPFTISGTIYGTSANDSATNYPASRTYQIVRGGNGVSSYNISGMGTGAALTNFTSTQFTSGTAHAFRFGIWHRV